MSAAESWDFEEILEIYDDDYEAFSEDFLKIRPKDGGLIPFVLNESQRFVLEKIKELREQLGAARILVLKGRQSGISTLAEGMSVHKTQLAAGIQSAVIAHTSKSSSTLFNMTRRFHDNLPDQIRIPTKRSNAYELAFDIIDSGIRVYTASGDEIGRGDTINGMLHLSEAAFYDNASEMLAGLLQSVASVADIIVESTANGMSGWFYSAWQLAEKAQRGELDDEGNPIISPFTPVFIPYFWVKEYKVKPPKGFKRTQTEQALVDMYGDQGLDDASLYWRRLKIAEFTDGERNPERVFDQEYPHCPEVAFTSTMLDGIIKSELVIRAQHTQLAANDDAPVIGVDVSAGDGKDRIIITRRWGTKFDQEEYKGNSADLIDYLYDLFERENPQAMLIDGGAMGITVVQGLHKKYHGINNRIHAIYFGGEAEDKTLYMNARAEMIGRLNVILNSDLPVDLPNDEELRAELCAYRGRKNAEKQLVLEAKEEIRKELGRSPDKGDSLKLTLARREYF
ncbi:hypothetical protein HOP38_02645 [Vibrio mediterranei]|uniref:hypothetical protein n=1 Tax=Vibrio mediterranei TaxID=689 RepID=UPI0018563F31|nr:hypothetical protein [Vibrio mediterranei]NUW71409.1 hypothetical protein [Vibrio mediterranei]